MKDKAKIAYKIGEKGERPWGEWKVTAVGDGYIKKEIKVNSGEILSLQMHHHRAEEWTIVSGSGFVTLEGEKHAAKPGMIFNIPQGAWHRIESTGNQQLVFHEIQTGKILDENDIVRAPGGDKYGRDKAPGDTK